MPLAQFFKYRGHPTAVSCFRLGGRFDELAGDTAHCGNNYCDRALVHGVPNDVSDFRDARSVRDRRATKFHDPKRLLHMRVERRVEQTMRVASGRAGVGPRERLNGGWRYITIFRWSSHRRGARATENS